MSFTRKDLLIISTAILIALIPGIILKYYYNAIELNPVKFAEEWSKIILSSTVLLYIAKYIEHSIADSSNKRIKSILKKELQLFSRQISILQTSDKIPLSEWNTIFQKLNDIGINDSKLLTLNRKVNDTGRLKDYEKESLIQEIKLYIKKTINGI